MLAGERDDLPEHALGGFLLHSDGQGIEKGKKANRFSLGKPFSFFRRQEVRSPFRGAARRARRPRRTRGFPARTRRTRSPLYASGKIGGLALKNEEEIVSRKRTRIAPHEDREESRGNAENAQERERRLEEILPRTPREVLVFFLIEAASRSPEPYAELIEYTTRRTPSAICCRSLRKLWRRRIGVLVSI